MAEDVAARENRTLGEELYTKYLMMHLAALKNFYICISVPRIIQQNVEKEHICVIFIENHLVCSGFTQHMHAAPTIAAYCANIIKMEK